MASILQQNALLDFLEVHPDLARGRIQNSKEGRVQAKRLWESCAAILNAQDILFNKTPDKWRKYYVDMKTKLRHKVHEQKASINATGGGPPRNIHLTAVQERLLTILGHDLGDPAPGVRHNPISQNVETQEPTPPVVDAAPTTTAETDSDGMVVVYYPMGSGEVVSETEQRPASRLEPALAPEEILEYEWPCEFPPTLPSYFVSERTQSPAPERPQTPAPPPPPPSPPVEVPQPTPPPAADSSRRRRRQRRPRTPLDEPVSELRAAQARLERLEAEAAAATREVAQATRELATATREGSYRVAAALEAIATRGIHIRVVMESSHPRRRPRLSSDEE